jgi:hypothetical protein
LAAFRGRDGSGMNGANTKAGGSRAYRRPWKIGVYSIVAGLWLSGGLWLLLHYFLTSESEFGPQRNPLEPWWLKFHGAFAFAAIWLFGLLWGKHVSLALRKGAMVRRRPCRAALLAHDERLSSLLHRGRRHSGNRISAALGGLASRLPCCCCGTASIAEKRTKTGRKTYSPTR